MLDFTITQCKMSKIQTLIVIFILAIVVAACGAETDRRLAKAEDIMADAPDSALVILQSIRPSDLRSEHSRALHSLLITQARSKNFIPIPSDSLIRQTADYFDGTSDTRHRMLAHYYLGDVRLELKSYAPALTAHFEALDLARELDDKFYIAMAARGISQIYHHNYLNTEELEFAKIAYENFLLAGKRPFTDDGLYFLANAYHNNGDYQNSIRLSHQLLDTISKTNDTFWKPQTLRLLGLSHFAINDFHESEKYYRLVCEFPDANHSDSTYLGVSLIRLGNIREASEIMQSLPTTNSNQDHWLRYNVYFAIDSTAKALEMMKALNSDIDSVLRSICKQNLSGSLIDYKENREAIAKANLKFSQAVMWCVILGSAFIILLIIHLSIRHSHRQQELIRHNIDTGNELRAIIKNLQDSESDLKENDKNSKSIISSLLAERFNDIDAICQKLIEHNSTKSRKKASQEIEAFIREYLENPQKNAWLEEYANKHFNGIMTKLKLDFPKLIETDRLFILYSRLGFSTNTIAFLLRDERITTTYDRRKRIKRKFLAFEGENRDIYLDIFS